MECGPESHRADHQVLVGGQFDPDALDEVARHVRTDRQHSRRVRIGVEVNGYHRVIDGVPHCVGADSVLFGGTVNLHTQIS